jgi:hypothetical protein
MPPRAPAMRGISSISFTHVSPRFSVRNLASNKRPFANHDEKRNETCLWREHYGRSVIASRPSKVYFWIDPIWAMLSGPVDRANAC